MGLQLTDIVKGREIELEELSGRIIAVDAFNWIYQFLSIIRQKDGEPLMDSQGRVTSHLSGIFYRTLKVMEAGIKPAYIFDGEPPAFKKQEAEKRHAIREEAAKEWKAALEKGDLTEARKYAMRSSVITEEIIEGSKDLLDAMGIPCVQAPSEGEALCAVMAASGDAHAAATQDYDSLLFGCPRLVRNLSITGRRKRGGAYVDVKTEIILLKNALDDLRIGREQLIILGILIGTDYNPGGVSGIGPKKALDIVKKHKTLESAMENVVWEFSIKPEEIFEFFRNPEKPDYRIEFRDVDEEKVKSIMCDKHDFSLERIENALNKLKEEKGKKKQGSLSKWF